MSKRLAFLIDLSGSIWIEREGRGTRKQVVDVELARALEGLPADAAFNLIPFTGEPLPWSDRLVPATRSNVRRAVRWFEECRESGTGNVWDALMLALADPELDTAVVLTDGAPTGGRRFHLDLLPALFAERNATRKVTVDVLLVGAARKLQERWDALARASGGRMLALDL